MRGRGSANQFAQIIHHQIRAMAPKLIGVSLASDANHKPELPIAASLYPRKCILDDNRSRGLNSEQLRRHQITVRGGFSCQVFGVDHIAIDLYVEEMLQLDCV